MAGIFLSWSAADEQAVTALKNKLLALNVPLWEYRDEMKVGQTIHETVVDAISDSIAAIVCFSDATADKPWIQYELAWAYQAYGKGAGKDRILPVWVGPHPADLRPAFVNHLNLAVGDMQLAPQREDFVTNVLPKLLGSKPPLVIPMALFAMTRAEAKPLFEGLLANQTLAPQLLTLCERFGMRTPPELVEQLTNRYGDSVNDFSPFENQQRLTDLIEDIVDGANVIRVSKELRPIFPRWIQDDLMGKKGAEANKAARKRWRAGRSLIVIDSISTLDANMAVMLDGFIERESSILWIPPYTLHTNAVSDLLRESAERVRRVADALDDWQDQAEPQLALDAPTELSVRLWLHRTFVAMSDTPQPIGERARGVAAHIPGPSRLTDLTARPTSVPPAFSEPRQP